MQMWHQCPSYSCLLSVQDDGCGSASLRLMTQLHYNTQLCTQLILCIHRVTTHTHTHKDTNATLFNPPGISEI